MYATMDNEIIDESKTEVGNTSQSYTSKMQTYFAATWN